MKINKNELRVPIDVDGTLIDRLPTDIDPNSIKNMFVTVDLNYYGKPVVKRIMKENIELLKSYKKRGYEVIVHSANGWKWCQEVVEKLGLTEFVDEVATKPMKYVDNEPADSWCQQVFIPEDKLFE